MTGRREFSPPPTSGNPLLPILKAAVQAQATDLHLKANQPPRITVDGRVRPLMGHEHEPLDPVNLPKMLFALVSPAQLEQFRREKELDTGLEVPGVGRFRLSLFLSTGAVAAVLRIVHTTIRTPVSLGLPPVLERIALEKDGLFLVTGPVASGKSTTLAALVDHVNTHTEGHIVVLEDPIEVVHPQKNCVVSQREIGKDSNGWLEAARAALRQSPTVVLMGELWGREALELAIRAAETGHLVIATLHTSDAVQTLQRLVDPFPTADREQLFVRLSQVLRGCLAQRLLPRADGRGRVPVFDLVVQTEAVQDAIRRGALDELYPLVEQGAADGMVGTMQSLLEHFRSGTLDATTCLAAAPNKQVMAAALRAELLALREAAEALASHGRPAPAPRASSGDAAASGDYIKVIKMHKPGGPFRQPPR